MTTRLARRRGIEIAAKRQSLDDELADWLKKTADEQQQLRRHHSQVRRLSAALEGLTESVKAVLPGPTADASAVLDKAEAWESQILAAHAIWEVFRSKLVLRQNDLFRDVLAACDDLAWACYMPVLQKLAPDTKCPPLVYFTSTASPFAVPRDSSFQNELRVGPILAGELGKSTFQRVLARLPVPLISVPWYQTFHVPGALIIAHEVGHVVESDLDLTASLTSALERAQLGQQETWLGWAREVFADVYGCLSLGPSFVGAAMDLLATSKLKVQTEKQLLRMHPPRALRIELMLEALQLLGYDADAVRLRAVWEEAYGSMQTLLDFKPDVKRVVPAVLAGPYRGIALTDIPGLSMVAGADFQTIGETAASGLPMDLDPDTDARVLFAAAQWMHENAPPDQHRPAYQALVQYVVGTSKNQFRFRGETVAEITDLVALLKPQEAADRQTGRDLEQLLLTILASPTGAGAPPDLPGR